MMKIKLSHNIGLKIISILSAFFLWLVIINIDDPTITTRIYGIPVTVKNENAITEAGKCYEITSSQTVNILVKGKKSVVDTLTSKDFSAVADLEKYSITNAVPVEVSLTSRFSSIPEITEGKNQTLIVSIEDYVSKQFNVEAKTSNSAEEGYYMSKDELSISPNRIVVSGPDSVIKKIKTVRVNVDISGVSGDFRTISEPKAYDTNGNSVTHSKLVFGIKNINVSGSPLIIAEPEIKLKVNGQPAADYQITGTSVSLNSVKIAASQKVLKTISDIAIETDVSNLTESLEQEYELTELLPEGVKLLSENTKATVKVEIEKLSEKTVDFTARDIKFVNLISDVSVDYDADTKLSVTVKGLENALEKVDVSSLVPKIDLENLKIGKQKAAIMFEEIEGVEYLNEAKLTIELTKNQAPPSAVPTVRPSITPTQTPSVTATPKPTEEPAVTATPEPTKTPEETKAPVQSTEPENTETPAPSATPE